MNIGKPRERELEQQQGGYVRADTIQSRLHLRKALTNLVARVGGGGLARDQSACDSRDASLRGAQSGKRV